MSFLDDDKLREECGVFGIFNNEDAALSTANNSTLNATWG